MQAEVPEIECVPLLPDGWIWYEVQPGDILVGLAERARISVAELAQANCLDVNSELSARTLLFIPDERAP